MTKVRTFLAWLTITYKCNLRCKWCYQREMAGSNQGMSKQLVFKLIDLLAGLSLENIILIGGEPTLSPDFFDLLKRIKDKGMRATVVTNSLRFASDRFTSRAKDAEIDDITTSLKGSTKKEYIESTGFDGFDIVKKAIRNLEDVGIRQRVSITVSDSIVANWNSMVEFIRNCGAKNFSISFEKPTILFEDITFDKKMMPNKIASFVENIMYPSLMDAGVKFRIEFMCPHCVFTEGFIKKVEKEGHAFGGCLLLRSRGIVFDPTGAVLPCNHFVNYPLGKYGEDFTTPEEFLRWRESDKIAQFYRTTALAPTKRCAECDQWSKCGAGCRLFWFYRGQNELLPNITRQKEKCYECV